MKSLPFVWLFLFTLNCWALDPYIIELNKVKDLPTNSVYDIFQDSKGFIWIAGNDGLMRYDGFEVKTYKNNQQTSFSGSRISEDYLGRIWYENFDGNLYFVENDSLKTFPIIKNSIGYFPYAFLGENLITVDKYGIKIYSLKTFKELKNFPVIFLGAQSANCNGEAYHCVIDNVVYTVDKNLNIKSNDYLKRFPKDIFLVNYFKGNCILTPKYNEEKKIFILKNNEIYPFVNTPDIGFIQGFSGINDKLWLFGQKGLFLLEEGKEQEYFVNKSISKMLKDNFGNIWVATLNEGIFIIPDFDYQNILTTGIQPSKILKLKDGFLIFTSNDEVYKTNDKLDDLQLLKKNADKAEVIVAHFNTKNNTLLYVSSKVYVVKNLDFKNQTSEMVAAKDFADIDNDFYAYAASGINGFLKIGDRIESSYWVKLHQNNTKSNTPNFSNIMTSQRGRTVFFDKDKNRLIFSGNLGLTLFDEQGMRKINYQKNEIFAREIEKWNHEYYILTTRGELLKTQDLISFQSVEDLFGFEKSSLKGIKVMSDFLVCYDQNEIHVFKSDNHQIKKMPINLRIDYREIKDLLVDNNNLLVLKSNGILKISLNNNNRNLAYPKLVINNFTVNNLFYNDLKNKILQHFENNIEVNYSILAYGNVENPKLYYKLNNQNWQNNSFVSRNIKFSNLAPGAYTLQLKIGANENSIQSFDFEILPPLWLRWWFIVSIVVLISGLGLAYFRWKIVNLKNKNRLLTEKIELEKNLSDSTLKAIKSQMNPHFFYNALNTIQAYIFTDDKQNASDYLAKFSKLTRMILEMSEKEKVLLQDEIKAITLYLELEKMRFETAFNFSIFIDNNVDVDFISIPSMIIQPYIENAIKHGLLHKKGEKMVSIAFVKMAQTLEITIEDNGIGRKKSEEINKSRPDKHASFSTNANQKRLEILNNGKSDKLAIEIIDKNSNMPNESGTIVIIRIPLN